jgi:ABC-2 type transport system permease protein
MKVFIAFVKKEFFHILRDRRTLFILIGMPVMQVLLFGYAVTNEFRGASLVVLDHSRDDLSIELTQRLESSGHFEIIQAVSSEDDIHEAFKAGSIKLAIVIPNDFSRQFSAGGQVPVQVIADGTDPNTATMLINYATMMLGHFQQEKQQGQTMPFAINVDTQMVYNPELKSVYMFVPGVMTMILLLISALMTSLTLAREKELGTMELLLVSPLPPLLIILGKVTPYILLAMIIGFMILSMGVFVFGVPVIGSLFLLFLVSILFIITSLALGIFISSRTNNQQTAMLLSMIGLMMPTMLLSGFIFPIESMPLLLQGISYIVPAKYFIVILKDIMLKGSPIHFIWTEVAFLTVVAFVFLGLSLKNFKLRLE